LSFAPRISHFFWNFKGGKSSGGATKVVIDKVDAFFLSFALPLAFMFAEHLVNFVGQFAGMQIELVFVGNEYKRPAKFAWWSDEEHSLASGLSWLLLLAVEKK
jgi:hypothetical protein